VEIPLESSFDEGELNNKIVRLDLLALVTALRDLGFEAARMEAGVKPCVAIYSRRGEAKIPGHHYVVFPHKDIWRRVKGSPVEVSEEDLGITVSRKDAYRLLREYDGSHFKDLSRYIGQSWPYWDRHFAYWDDPYCGYNCEFMPYGGSGK
jgi:hypothetical protein